MDRDPDTSKSKRLPMFDVAERVVRALFESPPTALQEAGNDPTWDSIRSATQQDPALRANLEFGLARDLMPYRRRRQRIRRNLVLLGLLIGVVVSGLVSVQGSVHAILGSSTGQVSSHPFLFILLALGLVWALVLLALSIQIAHESDRRLRRFLLRLTIRRMLLAVAATILAGGIGEWTIRQSSEPLVAGVVFVILYGLCALALTARTAIALARYREQYRDSYNRLYSSRRSRDPSNRRIPIR